MVSGQSLGTKLLVGLGYLDAIGQATGSIGSTIASAKGLFGSSGGTSVYKTLLIDKYQRKRALNNQMIYDKWYLNNITNNLNKTNARYMPSWTRQGMEKAGFNPLLAYMNSISPSSVTAGSVGGSNANAVEGNDSQSASAFLNALVGMKQVDSQIRNTNANTALQNEQTRTETYKQLNLQADSALKEIQTLIEKGNLSWQEKEKYVNLQKEIMSTKVMLMNAQSQQVMSNASMVNANASDFNARHKGYNTTVKAGPLLFSHTGDSNKYTKSKDNYHYTTEVINGRKVKVKVYD